jgi:predicted GNAT family N-acyltransferase
METEDFVVLPAAWDTHGEDIRHLRREVFMHEQAVPEEEEWDADDPVSRYVIAVDRSGRVLGTGRLAPDGKIGRMAVLRGQRRRGIGTALLQTLLTIARDQGIHTVYLHAQSQALAFYAGQGFIARGPEFNEAGITHRKMVLTLSRKPG